MKLNLPNKITFSRIFLTLVMIFFYLTDFVPYGKIIAVILFIIAACTDFIDGHIARKYNLVTNLGKLLDPIADKLLVMSALVMVVADGTIPAPYGALACITIIGRDFIIGALRQVVAANGKVLAADKWGKYKTACLDTTIPMIMAIAFNTEYNIVSGMWLVGFTIFTYAIFAIAIFLTIYSGANYLIKNKSAYLE
ncbi:MAG: CDP-diacylglycerol--glycerol-3-phosphate 3-phosphatidyltransferase [Clostridia bacterium]|jgi:CDP-diacylglycerol--glycerol-3-phosphate 3-phosphatidyltransferase